MEVDEKKLIRGVTLAAVSHDIIEGNHFIHFRVGVYALDLRAQGFAVERMIVSDQDSHCAAGQKKSDLI